MSDLAAGCAFALYRFAGRVGAPLVRVLLRRRAAPESYALAQADPLDKIMKALRPHLDQEAECRPDAYA
ncbi:MAG: hypothetical protein V3T57_01410 [Kiloniellales bacterium]